MLAVGLLLLACLVFDCSVSGTRRRSTQTIDSDALNIFAAFLVAQKQGPAFANHLLPSYRGLHGQHASKDNLNHGSRHLPVRLDADRCYYGELDAEGNVLQGARPRVARGTPLMPSPSNTPLEVVDAQFLALSRDYDSRSIGDAFAHVSPKIVAQHNLDATKFKQILSGPQMEGIIGCDTWEVLDVSSPSDERKVVSLKVLPKPIAGCVKTRGVAGQGGITWPTYWKWELGKVEEGEMAGCWMLEQMIPQAPPATATIDVDKQRAPEAGPVLSVTAKRRVQRRPSQADQGAEFNSQLPFLKEK